MGIVLMEGFGYIVLTLQAATDKWDLLALLVFVGILLMGVAAIVADTRFSNLVPVAAVGQILCGVVLLVMTPDLLRQGYLPMAVLHMLLGVCSLFMNAEAQRVNPKIPDGVQ